MPHSTVTAGHRLANAIDCTPVGNQMKAEFYESAAGPLGFMAQGSEYGFGKMYARGINDEALTMNGAAGRVSLINSNAATPACPVSRRASH